MQVNGYKTNPGEILGLNGSADFYGKNPAELRKEFKNSLKVFLKVCKEKGINPPKEYSGKFNLRIPARLHSEITARASVEDKSINQLVSEILEQSVRD